LTEQASAGAAATDWWGVGFALTIGVAAAYQQFKLPPVLPLLSDSYGYGRTFAGSLMSVYAVAGLVLSFGIGDVLARGHGRTLIAAAFACFLIGAVVSLSLPAEGAAMLLGRGFEGAGLAIVAITGPAIAAAAANPRHRPLAIGLWAMWMPIGQALANLIAVPSLAQDAWTPLWWAGILLTVIAAAWTLRRRGGTAAVPAQPVAASSGLSLTRPVLLAALTFLLWTVQYLAFMTWLPTFLVEARGLTPAAAALTHTVAPLLLIPFNFLAGVLLARGTALTTLLVASLAIQTLAWLVGPSTGAIAGLAFLGLWGAASGVTATCLFSLPVALSREGSPARAFGVLMTGRNLGVLVGPLLMAQGLEATGSWTVSAAAIGVLTAVAAGTGLLVGRHLPEASG